MDKHIAELIRGKLRNMEYGAVFHSQDFKSQQLLDDMSYCFHMPIYLVKKVAEILIKDRSTLVGVAEGISDILMIVEKYAENKKSEQNQVLPPGKYYLGDPCYLANEIAMDQISHNVIHSKMVIGSWDGYTFAAGATPGDGVYTFGDGVYNGHIKLYKDSDSVEYAFPVDSGILGCIPIELCDIAKFDCSLGAIFTFEESIEVDIELGIFHFTSGHRTIYIDTN